MDRVAGLLFWVNKIHFAGCPVSLMPFPTLAPNITALHLDDHHALIAVKEHEIALSLSSEITLDPTHVSRVEPAE